MPRVLPFGFQVGLLRGHRLLAAIERMLFRLQPIGQLGRVFAKLLERVFDGRSHLGDFGRAGPPTTCSAARSTTACGVPL